MIKKFLSFVLMICVVAINFGFVAPQEASAASLTALSDTVTNLSASAAANHTIVFTTPTGITTTKTIILTFDNSTSTTGIVFGDIDIHNGTTDVPVAATASATDWGISNTSPAITITSPSSGTPAAPGAVITIEIGTHATFGTTGTNRITNGTAGTTLLRISGNFGDTGAISMSIIANSIVAVAAEVLSTISFTVSDNTIFYGNLRTAGVCFAQGTDPGFVTCPTTTETEAFNMTAGTNATSGYSVSVQGATLTSGANTITALAANTASSPGTEQFGLRMNAAGGSGTVSAPYAAAGYAYTGTAATPATVATATAPSATTTYSVRYMANIDAVTQAGSYTTAHTYIATGNF